MLERDIQRAILSYLRLLGFFAIRVNQQGVPLHNGSGKFRPGPTKGVSDVHSIIVGRAWWIEVKVPGKKPTEHQDEFMEAVRKAGGVSFVATSVDDVRRALAEHGVATREVA